MRADGLPYIPPCPVCDTDTPRFLTVGLVSWAIKCRDKDCGFKLKHEQESVLRDLWARLQPAEVDPIAELEAMNARMAITMGSLWWIVANERNIDTGREQIEWPFTQANARAAAARLLARVRGAK